VIIPDQKLQQGTGVVKSGKTFVPYKLVISMNLVEMFNNEPDPYDYDMADDIIFFMKNDSDFYRKHYFPLFVKISDMQKSDKDYDWGADVKQVILTAIKEYSEKFGVPLKVISKKQNLISNIKNQLWEHELENINNGAY